MGMPSLPTPAPAKAFFVDQTPTPGVLNPGAGGRRMMISPFQRIGDRRRQGVLVLQLDLHGDDAVAGRINQQRHIIAGGV